MYHIPISPEVLFAEVSQRERRVELVLRVMALLSQEPIGIQDHHLIERPALQEGGYDSSPRCSPVATNANARETTRNCKIALEVEEVALVRPPPGDRGSKEAGFTQPI